MTQSGEQIPDDQAEVIEFLSRPESYPAKAGPVEKIETHGAIVFLAGDEVWKIKRAVRFPYMDLSTLEKRRVVCEREVEINRVWAPQLYLGCVPITREQSGRLACGGEGKPVEWAVRMRRFAQEDLLGNIADAEGISRDLARDLADLAFESHVRAPHVHDPRGADRVARLVQSVPRNLAGVAAVVGVSEASLFRDRAEKQLARASAVLNQRAAKGFVRRCHGDLHLGNIVLWEGRPLLFDAIEFDEELASIDTFYDLAFLLMDLDHRGLRPASNIVLNRYLWRSQQPLDLDALAALPLFLGLRAGIRALVSAQRAQQEQAKPGREAAAAAQSKRAQAYMRAALDYLDLPAPKLVGVGGLSGSGKSTVAAALAPKIGACPGAVHLRSDLERKALFGCDETDRLGGEAYTEAASARVYRVLMEKAERVLAASHSVIVDAVFAKSDERERVEAAGASTDVPFRGLWLTAPPAILMERVARRRNDASDATVDVVQMQLGFDVGELSSAWKVVDAEWDQERTAQLAEAALSE